ncbi:unnamed protein product [Prunus armeniaca]|uniref:Retroviral polymerase SH3-like domain-containing protein n=1 Tax=Prunus armeniaca TaxID=36596 RepID=A0A6J5W451_PRUAR|nr:unnamed protein product [Prunus armeniaca]
MNVETKSGAGSSESKAFVASAKKQASKNFKGKKGNMECCHCEQKGHTKDRCWILHPHLKPKFGKEGKGEQKHSANQVSAADDFEKFTTNPSVFLGEFAAYLHQKNENPNHSGATDHMTNKKQYLCDFKNFTKAHSASVAYGTDVSVLGQGKDRITKKNIGEDKLCWHTPTNGVAERKNRDLLEKTRSLMLQINVPKKVWSQGVLTVAYVINRLPSRVLNYKSPPEVLKGRKIDLSPLRIFGYVRFVHIQGLHRDKFDLRAAKCVFMGYSSTQKGKGESFLDQVPLPIVETIDDHSPTSVPCSRDITSSNEGTPSNNEGTPFDSVRTELISILPSLVAPRRNPSRARNPPPKFKDYVSCATRYPVERYITYANVSRSHAAFLSKISNSCEPSSFQEAKTQFIWQKAMRE